MPGRPWTRDELIVAFNLYCKLPFGRLHGRNPVIKKLANALGRTSNSVAMKLCNFASFDPALERRGRNGLQKASAADRAIWDEFNASWPELGLQSEAAFQRLVGHAAETPELPDLAEPPDRPTEARRLQRVRLGQDFFRTTVLACYLEKCAVCELNCPPLLVAGHIIPWSARPELRLDPRNGLCLCALHDKAFDRGLISVDPEFKLLVSPRIDSHLPREIIHSMFAALRGGPLRLPEKFRPKPEHLAHHRDTIFDAA